jgi:hypothetical protein
MTSTSPQSRRRLARAIERLVEDAAAPPRPLRGSAAPINRYEIERCRGLLEEVADELRADQDVEGALEPALRHARAALLLR